MGWLWSSSGSTAPSQNISASPPAPQSLFSSAQSSTTPVTASASTAPSSLTPADLADQELQSFLREISSDVSQQESPAPAKKFTRLPRFPNTSPSALPSTTSSQSDEQSDLPLSEQLLPTKLSCRDTFDRAFYCNSFGGRFNDLYRYGTLRSCSETWGDFWFCMRTRTYSSPSKENAIRDHFREKERRKYGGPEERKARVLGLGLVGNGMGEEKKDDRGWGGSSEDVWRSRERMVERGTTFNKETPDFEGTDEEWRVQLREWRRKEAGGEEEKSEGSEGCGV